MITADTNVFFYLSDDHDQAKQQTAISVSGALEFYGARIALQVVGELQNSLHRKLKLPPWQASQASYNLLQAFDCFTYTRRAVERALQLSASGQLSYWDALLVSSAQEAGCDVLLTEDMQDGANLLGVEIVNPFGKDGALTPRARELLDL